MGEELLAQVLEECLEEDLSFVPPEREIARKHKFSDKFEEAMKAILADSSQNIKKREIQKHFYPRYGHLAACVLIFCVCGWLFWSLMGPLGNGDKGASEGADITAASAEYAADMEEEAAPEEAPESEEPAESAPEIAESESAAAAAGTEVAGAEEKTWCGQTVYYAEQQEVPETLENVTTLVNCPVLAEDDPVLYLTIGNVGEKAVQYLNKYELEVWLEDGWYVIPAAASGTGTWTELEAGMAVDMEIDLADYQIDYEAQQYRLIVYVDRQAVSAEFTFEEVFSERMEKLEEEETSRE